MRLEIATGEFVMPLTDGSAVYIGKHTLSFTDLAKWIRQLHALATRLATGTPPE